MPKSKSENNRAQATPNRNKQDWWSNFVPGDMYDSDKEACREWLKDPELFLDLLQRLCDAQYKFSAKKELSRPGYIAFIQPALTGHKHDGWILSGRGSTPYKALKQALYRHFVMFDEEWPTDVDQTTEEAFND